MSATAVLAPKAGLTAEDCTITEWAVEVGAAVSAGQPIAVIETYKASIEVLAPCDGVLLAARPSGDVVPSGAAIGVVGAPGDDATGLLDTPGLRLPGEPSPTAPPPAAPAPRRDGERRMSSPAARKRAAELGLDVSVVAGTGPGGRITLADVETAAGRLGGTERAEPSPMRKAIVASTTASALIPQFVVDATVECTQLLAERDRLAEHGTAVTITDLIVVDAAAALRASPQLAPAGAPVDVGIVVALDDGMLIPVVRHADQLGPAEVHAEIGRLASGARQGMLDDRDVGGGCLAVSNLGAHRVERFTALLPPGYRGVLAVGSIATRPWVTGGAVVPRPQMSLALTCDHRSVDGVAAARFLSTLCDRLEGASPEPGTSE